MRIKEVRSYALTASVERPLYFGIGPFPTFFATLVEVTTDTGITGVGECIVRKAPQVTKRIVEEILAPVVIGKDPWDVEGLWQEMFDQLRRWGHSRGFFLEAMSGVDIALWDILGKSVGLPVSKVLTGFGRERVRCYASSIYFADLERMVAEAKEQVQRGHTAIKVKIGRAPEQGGLRMDVAVVRAIREAVGPGVEIMWTPTVPTMLRRRYGWGGTWRSWTLPGLRNLSLPMTWRGIAVFGGAYGSPLLAGSPNSVSSVFGTSSCAGVLTSSNPTSPGWAGSRGRGKWRPWRTPTTLPSLPIPGSPGASATWPRSISPRRPRISSPTKPCSLRTHWWISSPSRFPSLARDTSRSRSGRAWASRWIPKRSGNSQILKVYVICNTPFITFHCPNISFALWACTS